MPALAVNFKNTIADAEQTAFTSPPSGQGTRIDSFTVVNDSAVNASYEVYIDTGLGTTAPIIPFRVVVWGDIDLGIGLVNQVIPPNASVKVVSSAVDSLYFTITGVNLD